MKPPRKRDTHDLVQIVGADEFTLGFLTKELGVAHEAGETVILHGTKPEVDAEVARCNEWAAASLPPDVDLHFEARERGAQ